MIAKFRPCVLALAATLVVSDAAFARNCTSMRDRSPKYSAILVASFTLADTHRRPPLHLDRIDKGGEIEIYSQPTEKDHDFVETDDPVGGPGVYYGRVEVMACQAGDYSLYTPSGGEDGTPVPVKLESNRVTYIGALRATGFQVSKQPSKYFGMYVWIWRSNPARDLEIVRRAWGVDVSNPLILTPPPPAGEPQGK